MITTVPYAGGNTLYPVDNSLENGLTVTPTITAYAGGGQTNAVNMTTAYNLITTCATAADSVKLPAATVGKCVFVANLTATSAQVYGQATETINAVASATGVALAAGKNALFVCAEAGKWRMILSA